jgi:hypothetical protein
MACRKACRSSREGVVLALTKAWRRGFVLGHALLIAQAPAGTLGDDRQGALSGLRCVHRAGFRHPASRGPAAMGWQGCVCVSPKATV